MPSQSLKRYPSPKQVRARGPDVDKPQNRAPTRNKRQKGRENDTLDPETFQFIGRLAEGGLADFDIARAVGISVSTLYRWAAVDEALRAVLDSGKGVFDMRIERTLASRAMGYSYESEKIMNIDGKVVRVPIVEHVPPDTTSMIFWLKNRQPLLWRDRKELGVDGDVNVHSDGPTDRQVAMAVINMLRDATDRAIEDKQFMELEANAESNRTEPAAQTANRSPEAGQHGDLAFRRRK